MAAVLVSWIGDHDYEYIKEGSSFSGPIVALLDQKVYSFSSVYLLYDNHNLPDTHKYCEKVRSEYGNKIHTHNIPLSNPTDYYEIYTAVKKVLENIYREYEYQAIEWHFHTSPGTSQMAAVWLLLSKTEYPATLYQSWLSADTKTPQVREIAFPFEITFTNEEEPKKPRGSTRMMEMMFEQDGQNNNLGNYCKLDDSAFSESFEHIIVPANESCKTHTQWQDQKEYTDIIHESNVMKRLMLTIARVAAFSKFPVLIFGESGTGKEMVARFVHKGSKRTGKFVVLNCAAMTESLAEATLFGWSKGAWTDAKGEGKGLVREAEQGTLFLDEIADLSLDIQTKLLRAIQFGEVRRVGDNESYRCDVRFVGATNKDLMAMVREKTFREDLFYRLCVGYIHLPPLRDRGDDVLLLAQHFLRESNAQFALVEDVGYQPKEFTDDAVDFMLQCPWYGNVRELENTIKRACMHTEGEYIDAYALDAVMMSPHIDRGSSASAVQFPIHLEEYLDGIRKEMIVKALAECDGALGKAAQMLGYNNYQTLSEHMKKLGIEKK